MTGPLSYKVMLGDGRVVRRHVDQIHPRQKLLVNTSEEGMDSRFPDFDVPENTTPVIAKEIEGTGTEDISSNPSEVSGDFSQHSEIIPEMNEPASPVLIMRRSQRTRNLPTHLKDYELK